MLLISATPSLVGESSAFSAASLLFYVLFALAIGSAVAMVTRKNAVTGAVWLIATFFSIAGAYLMLSATFLAAIQALVYAGAMMVLFVFVIMVLDVNEEGDEKLKMTTSPRRLLGSGVAVIVVGLLGWILLGVWTRQYLTTGPELAAQGEFGTATAMGRLLFHEYLFAFEAISLPLFAAVMGAVVVARARRAPAAADELVRMSLAPITDFGQPSGSDHQGGA